MSYLPVGDTASTIDWYDHKCAELKRFASDDAAAFYCKMADHLRKIQGITNPPPPPPPPPFVAVDVPPESVAQGSAYEEYWRQQAASQERTKKLMIVGAIGLAAFMILKR